MDGLKEPNWNPAYVCCCCGTFPGNSIVYAVMPEPTQPTVIQYLDSVSFEPSWFSIPRRYEAKYFCTGCREYILNHMRGDQIIAMGEAWNVRKVL